MLFISVIVISIIHSMKKISAFLLLILCCTVLHAQQNILIKGQVIDAVTKKPLQSATIVCKEKNIVVITDNEGKFLLGNKISKEDSLVITVSYIGYETKTIKILPFKMLREISIHLKPTDKGLGEVTVNPDLMQYIFFGSPQTQVLDYTFFQSGWLIALYNYHDDKTTIIYLGKSKNILFEKEFPNRNFENFYMSCNNRYYAESENEIIEIFISNSGIEFNPVEFNFYTKSIKYYAGAKGKYFYITQFSHQNIFQDFFLDDNELKKIEKQPFAKVIRENDLKLLAASEDRIAFKEQTANLNASHGIYVKYNDPIVTENRKILDKLVTDIEIERTKFIEHEAYQSYIFKEIFAPFYVMDSSLILVNYYQNIIQQYSFDGKLIDTISLKINNEKRKSWQTFYDTFSKKIYYRLENADTTQSIYELNIASGKSKEKRKILRSEIYNVKVSNGYVYYLFNPPKTNKVFLFREKINE